MYIEPLYPCPYNHRRTQQKVAGNPRIIKPPKGQMNITRLSMIPHGRDLEMVINLQAQISVNRVKS
jgi:hypothetical protein